MITLYTIGCPRCKILEEKLNAAKIEYKKIDKLDEMPKEVVEQDRYPMLSVDDKLLNYVSAVKWLNDSTNN